MVRNSVREMKGLKFRQRHELFEIQAEAGRGRNSGRGRKG